ncbi:MAG: LptA/OstA family protein [Betaproteobacteria bacterium]
MRKSDARADARAGSGAGDARERFAGSVAAAVCVALFGCVAMVGASFVPGGGWVALAQVQAQAQAQAPAQASSKSGATAADGESLEMTAEEVRYQGKDQVTVAEGKVVIVYKSFRITGDHAEYDDRVPCVRARGKDKARFEDTKEKTVLSAGEIVFYPNEEKVDASGGVSVSYQDGRVQASGDRISYLGKEKKGVVTGNARVEMGRKVFTAGSITVLFADETVIATGGTRTIIPGEEITAPGASGSSEAR